MPTTTTKLDDLINPAYSDQGAMNVRRQRQRSMAFVEECISKNAFDSAMADDMLTKWADLVPPHLIADECGIGRWELGGLGTFYIRGTSQITGLRRSYFWCGTTWKTRG